jgi:hypothetical protein
MGEDKGNGNRYPFPLFGYFKTLSDHVIDVWYHKFCNYQPHDSREKLRFMSLIIGTKIFCPICASHDEIFVPHDASK